MEEKEADLQDLRGDVAALTKQIVRLIASRNELAERIGRVKSKDSLPLEDERVEDALLKEVLNECEQLGVDKEVGARVLSILVSESKRVQGMTRATTPLVTPMNMFARAMELQRTGRKILRLDVGEPDFRPPEAVVKAVTDALHDFKTHYTQTRGIPQLVSALQQYLKRKHGYDATEKQVIVNPGGRFSVYSALASLLKEGDRCVIIEPNWPAYKEAVKYIGARPTVIHTTLEDGWEPSLEDVKESMMTNTKVLVLSYPANPTGKIIDPRLFKEIVGVANDRGVTVLSDEIYTDYAYKECPSILDSGSSNFVLTASFSKAWAMTGFRVGYAVSSEEVISRMHKVQSLMITSVPEFVQYGAIKALESDDEVAENARAMRERIEVASGELEKSDALEYYKPDGAMYVFPRAKSRSFDSSSFSMKLLEEKSVTVSPGSGFGEYPDCFRISLGQSKDTITEGIRRIGELLR